MTDRQLDAIRDTDGIVGFNLSVNDVRGDGNLDPETPLETVASHIDYIANKVGHTRIALGSDFDGAVIPSAIKDAGGLQKLLQALANRSFSRSEIDDFAMRNWLRLFGSTWKTAP